MLRLGLLVLAVAVTAALHARMPLASRAEQVDAFVPRPEVARLLSLGFDGVLADFYWLQVVQIVGAGEGYSRASLVGRLVDVTTAVNPWVAHPYRLAAVFLTQSVEQVREANRLLRRAIAFHPKDWRNPFYLGFNQFFYLGDYEAAADSLEGAIGLSGGDPPYGGPRVLDPPVYLSRLVARLRAHGGDLDTAAALLAELARSAEDESARDQFRDALLEVETERRARVLDAARTRYRELHGRDIAVPADLARGPQPVLPALPEELHGAGWALDDASGRIVSAHYGRRYEPHAHQIDRERRESWGTE
jgi:tetratricopeptide (TPR) repeat protein